jgi:uncharacterized membrane protein YphA (DoxX/SURF4 family)
MRLIFQKLKRSTSTLLKIAFVALLLLCIFYSTSASAHEAYVLPYDTFWHGVEGSWSDIAFAAMENPQNLHLVIKIVLWVWLFLGLNFLFSGTNVGKKVDAWFEQYAHFGPHFVRGTIAIVFLFSAVGNCFLGPELHLSLFTYPFAVRVLLFVMSIMIFLGIFTEIAAAIGVFLFLWSYQVFGAYMFTYLNYAGELVVLLLFGMRVFSVDRFLFGPLKRFLWFEKYETVIVRVFYGAALIYAAITVKLLHPDLTTYVVNEWNLTRFHWLFPSDPLLVTLGAGIVEAVIGIFIIFGFELRLTVLVSLFYITLSLLYFRELVWPHLLLYGISINLLVQPEVFTLDHLLLERLPGMHPWWKRPFLSHTHKGKSIPTVKKHLL